MIWERDVIGEIIIVISESILTNQDSETLRAFILIIIVKFLIALIRVQSKMFSRALFGADSENVIRLCLSGQYF